MIIQKMYYFFSGAKMPQLFCLSTKIRPHVNFEKWVSFHNNVRP